MRVNSSFLTSNQVNSKSKQCNQGISMKNSTQSDQLNLSFKGGITGSKARIAAMLLALVAPMHDASARILVGLRSPEEVGTVIFDKFTLEKSVMLDNLQAFADKLCKAPTDKFPVITREIISEREFIDPRSIGAIISVNPADYPVVYCAGEFKDRRMIDGMLENDNPYRGVTLGGYSLHSRTQVQPPIRTGGGLENRGQGSTAITNIGTVGGDVNGRVNGPVNGGNTAIQGSTIIRSNSLNTTTIAR